MSSYLDYEQLTSENNVLEVAKRVGLNIMISDSEVTSQHFADHQQIVFANLAAGTAISAIPLLNKTATIPCEMWFFMNGELWHRILFTEKSEGSTITQQGPMDNEDYQSQFCANSGMLTTMSRRLIS